MDTTNLNALPAIYATKPYPGVSSSYVFIPTRPIVEGLVDSGWEVMGASQTKSRSEERAPYARHMLRFRHEDFDSLDDPRGGKLFPEMILVNGHDGTATYRLYSGLFSFVCANGLIVGTMLGGATVRHSGYAATLEAVQYGAVKIITEELPVLINAVKTMAGKSIARSEQHDFARRALELRYHGLPPLLTTDQLLEKRREQDAANDVWTTLNVIQENVLSRTHSGRSFTGRRSNIRAVKAIKEQVNINRGLWDHAMKLAA
jgi:hypothetical protein